MSLSPSGWMMKTLVVFGILLHVSLHSSAAVIEVFEEADSVSSPCFYGGDVPEDPSVIWTHNGPNPNVFLLRQGGNDPRGQNQIYRGRTSMNPDASDTGNYSLTFRDPQSSDSGSYICSISDGIKEIKSTEVQLNVKDDQSEVKVNKDADSVILPCKRSANLPSDTKVEWIRSEPEFMFVHAYPHTSGGCGEWDNLYCGRTRMNEDSSRTGDLSSSSRFPSDRDTGRYICTVYRDKDISRQRVVSEQVKHSDPEDLPIWVTVSVVSIILSVLVVSAGVLYWCFRHYFMRVPEVYLANSPLYSTRDRKGYRTDDLMLVVDSGAKSISSPFGTSIPSPEDVRVEWLDKRDRKVHVYQNGSNKPEEQHQFYRNRTKINKKQSRTHSDLSSTSKRPTVKDSNIYTCIAYNRRGNISTMKDVNLRVKGKKG